jgi:hypothetical protein
MLKTEGQAGGPSVTDEATALVGLFQRVLTASPGLLADVEAYIDECLAASPQLKRCAWK